jgi:hypothetical protein
MNLNELLTWEAMVEDDLYQRCLNYLLESVEEIKSEVVMIPMASLPQGLMKVKSIEEMDPTQLLDENRPEFYLLLYKEKQLLRLHFKGTTYIEWLKYEPWTGKELKDLTLPTRGRITKTRINVQKPRPLRASSES